MFELVVCRVRFARVPCPRLRFVIKKKFVQTIDKLVAGRYLVCRFN